MALAEAKSSNNFEIWLLRLITDTTYNADIFKMWEALIGSPIREVVVAGKRLWLLVVPDNLPFRSIDQRRKHLIERRERLLTKLGWFVGGGGVLTHCVAFSWVSLPGDKRYIFFMTTYSSLQTLLDSRKHRAFIETWQPVPPGQ